MSMSGKLPPLYPRAVSHREDSNGLKLGVYQIPRALFEMDLDLTPNELLFVIALLHHYRPEQLEFEEDGEVTHELFLPSPSYRRIGKMVNLAPNTVARIARKLDVRGLVRRSGAFCSYAGNGGVFCFDLRPLLKAMEIAPLKPRLSEEQ